MRSQILASPSKTMAFRQYPREADFARVRLFMCLGILPAVRGRIVLGAASIRYRRSLNAFDRYTIR